MDTFPDIPKPSDVKLTSTWNILKASFGDNYEQFSADGANPKKDSYELSWDILRDEDHEALETFLDTQTPVKAFYWDNPLSGNNEVVRMDISGLSSQKEGVNYAKVSVKLNKAYGY